VVEDGAYHQSIEDLALTCALPGMTVVVPADGRETAQVIRTAAETEGPFYIRLPRTKAPDVYPADYQFRVGKAVWLRQGKDVAIIATGLLVATALKAAEELSKEGLNCAVISMPTLKPIDEAAIREAAMGCGAIVTAEEHLEHGGLGSIVSRVVARSHPVPVEIMAIRDAFGKSGKPEELLCQYGLDVPDICVAARLAHARKLG
jgi:transketolase